MAGKAKGLGLLAVGLVAGGVAAALVTPRDGRGMRKAIRKEIRHQRHSAARFARNVAD